MKAPNVFSMDFDGVFTDDTGLDLVIVNQEHFFWSPFSVQYFPLRRGALQIASFLSYFGKLVIITARPAGHHQQIRDWLRKYAGEFEELEIISSHSVDKTKILKDLNIRLHVDDDFINQKEIEKSRTIIWSHESPGQILRKITSKLSDVLINELTIEILSLGSSTPTFLIKRGNDSTKLRLFRERGLANKVKEFYSLADGIDDKVFLPVVIQWFPLAVETLFIEGEMAEDLDTNRRVELIPLLANFLKKLHSVQTAKNPEVFISCAIDRFNLCLTVLGEIALIDVCDCLVANKWVDVIWAEQLFCSSDDQREYFVNCYMDAATDFPTSEEIRDSLKEYYSWLHYIVASGRSWNREDAALIQESEKISILRREPVKISMLQHYAR